MNTIFSPLYLKTSAVIISIIAIFSISGGGDYEDGYWEKQNSTFSPEVFVDDKSCEPLFFSNPVIYGYENYWVSYSNRFVGYQVDDWNTYLNNEISKEELQTIIGSDSLNNVLSKIDTAIKNDKPNSTSKRYNLDNVKVKEFFKFINLAKSLESSTNFYPEWDYKTETYSQSPKVKSTELKNIEKLYTETKDVFLKEKYWFLNLKASFYSENQNNTISFFNATAASVSKSINYYRALSYVAGVNYKQKKYALSNYQYAVVFENCPSLRNESTFNFRPQETKDFNESLKMVKNDNEKAALWALFGYYADPVEAISKIYEIDPKNKHLAYLLTRAVNAEEHNFNKTEYRKYSSNATVHDSKLDERLYKLVNDIASKKNTLTPYMWHIVTGYFETIKGNYSKATTCFNDARNCAPESSLVQRQIKLFEIFNQVSKTKVMNTATENELLPSLTWLYELDKNSHEYYDESIEFRNEDAKLRTSFLVVWTKSYISKLYKKQKNEVMAELFSRESNFYASEERLKKMQKYFIENKNTPWDKFAQSLYSVTLDDIYEYKGILYAYKNQIDKAISEFKKCNKAENLYGNPFNGKIMDCIQCDHYAKQKTKYTKLAFLEKIKEIQNNIANGVDVHSGNILLGNAFYNMSYYGNARFFYDNPIIDQYGNYIDEEYDGILMSNTFAENYYQKALSTAQNDEEKAKATYLLTKIERNKFYLSDAFKPYEVDYIIFDGYKKLKQNYSNTKYYQEVIRECGYFSRYAEY